MSIATVSAGQVITASKMNEIINALNKVPTGYGMSSSTVKNTTQSSSGNTYAPSGGTWYCYFLTGTSAKYVNYYSGGSLMTDDGAFNGICVKIS